MNQPMNLLVLKKELVYGEISLLISIFRLPKTRI
jgi:hypothetical protein